MLKEIRLKNFKAFGKEQTFELAPLTLVFGRNSVGKSTLVQAMQLLTQSIRAQGPWFSMAFRGRRGLRLLPYVDGGETDLGDAAACIHTMVTGAKPRSARIGVTADMTDGRRKSFGEDREEAILNLGESHTLLFERDYRGRSSFLRLGGAQGSQGCEVLDDVAGLVDWSLDLGRKGTTRDVLTQHGIEWPSEGRGAVCQSKRKILDREFPKAVVRGLQDGELHEEIWDLLVGLVGMMIDDERALSTMWFGLGARDGDDRVVTREEDLLRMNRSDLRALRDPGSMSASINAWIQSVDVDVTRPLREREAKRAVDDSLRPSRGIAWLACVVEIPEGAAAGMGADLPRGLRSKILDWFSGNVNVERVNTLVAQLRAADDDVRASGAVSGFGDLKKSFRKAVDMPSVAVAALQWSIENMLVDSVIKSRVNRRMEQLFAGIEYVKAVRDEFPRFMRSSQVGSDEDATDQTSGTRSFSGRRGGSDYRFGEKKDLDRVNRVLQSLEIPYELDQRVLASGHFWELVVREQVGDGYREMNLADVGFGIGQLVPMAMALASRTPCTVIEEPEAHLHPGLQSKLGDLFIESLVPEERHGRRPPKQIIAETHSEHLVLRVLRRIREGKISPEQVSVLYVDRVEGMSTVQRLRIDDEGEFQNEWPHGFFEERWEDLG